MSYTKTKPNKKIEQWVEKGIFIIKGNFTGYQTELYSFAYEPSFCFINHYEVITRE